MVDTVACPDVGLTVKLCVGDHALRFPARSAVRTRQKRVVWGRPPLLPTLGGMRTQFSVTAPR